MVDNSGNNSLSSGDGSVALGAAGIRPRAGAGAGAGARAGAVDGMFVTTTAEPLVDLAMPIETEASASTAVPELSHNQPPPAAVLTTGSPALSTAEPGQEQLQDNTVAVALIIGILVVLVLFTVIYVLYQKRRRLCGQRQSGKDRNSKPDLSANEALITPVKSNGGVESGVSSGGGGGLVSGPRESKPRQSIPRKWYDSAAMKYMDQSTDTLDRV